MWCGLKSWIYKELLQLKDKEMATPLEYEQRNWIDIFPKKTNCWPISTWKYARQHWSLGKCQLKPQGTTSHPSGWLPPPKKKRDMQAWVGCGEIRNSCTSDRNIGRCSCCGKQLAVPQKVKYRVTCDPAILLLGVSPKELRAGTCT